MNEVWVGSHSDGLMLCGEDWAGGSAGALEVRLVTSGLEARKRIHLLRSEDLVAFFESLAADWKGWTGERAYRSLEGDLTLTAIHEGRHVRIVVALVEWANPGGWHATANLSVEPGEELSRLAADARDALTPAL